MRKATACAVDREFIITALLLGDPTEARTGFHPGSLFYEPNVEPYDLEANQVLDDAGPRCRPPIRPANRGKRAI